MLNIGVPWLSKERFNFSYMHQHYTRMSTFVLAHSLGKSIYIFLYFCLFVILGVHFLVFFLFQTPAGYADPRMVAFPPHDGSYTNLLLTYSTG